MRKWCTSLIFGIGVLLTASASTVFAATPAPSPAAASTNGSPGQGLEVSPPVIELSAKPGETVTTSIRIRDVTKNILIAKGKADDFGAGPNEDGNPHILLDENGETRYSLKYWIQDVPDLRLNPQELKTATITIVVPSNAEPGGHFGVVRFTAVPPDLEGTGVALSASVGSLILLKVAGNINENVTLAEFSTSQGGKKGSLFEHGPIDFLVRLNNEGSVHEKVQGKIDVKNGVGHKIASVPVNATGGNVLPGSIRKFTQQLTNKRLFGRYTAELTMAYTGGRVISATKTFWVIPWKLLLLLLIGLIVLIYLLRLGIRKYNQAIIARARRSQR